MVSLGTNLVAGTAIPLGIVAAGTGNDMARGLGLPLGDADAAIRTLLDSLDREPRVIDAASVGTATSPPGTPACSRRASTPSSTSARTP